MKTLSMLAVAALVFSGPAAAQQGGPPQNMPMAHGQEPAHCMAMLGGPSPQMLLENRDALGLTAEQVSRIEALRDEAMEAVMPHMQTAMSAHGLAARQLQAHPPDFKAYEAGLREIADQMVLAHVAVARIAVRTGNLLTPEQRATLEERMSQNAMMGDRQGMSGNAAGMGPGGMGGMFEHCAMMDMGRMSPGG